MITTLKQDGTQVIHPSNVKPDLEFLQGQVGGYIELVTLDGAQLFVNEEGKIKGLPVNLQATEVFHFGGGNPEDYIVGDAVVVTEPDYVD